MESRRKQTKAMLIEHFKKYPKLQLQDLFKFLHQSSFGCEHLLADASAAVEYIRKEASACRARQGENPLLADGVYQGENLEPLDGDFCRVHLDVVKAGLSAETLGKLFFLSAKPVENGRELLEEKLSVLLKLISEGNLPFSLAEAEREIEKWRNEGFPARHHSEMFREHYTPAYRVIKKEYALFLPLFLEIDKRLAQGLEKPQRVDGDTASGDGADGHQGTSLLLAIEGGSAGGKTTLSGLLEAVYGATVFHMDDFFLRPEQRTKERFAEPGGNVDRERFLAEVLIPLKAGETVKYRRFDCSTFTLQEPIEMKPGRLTVVEGAYSMHPELAEYYDFSVFLDVSSEVQKKRIQKRNSSEFATRFFEEWIPMERRYFEAMNVKERCDLVLAICH